MIDDLLRKEAIKKDSPLISILKESGADQRRRFVENLIMMNDGTLGPISPFDEIADYIEANTRGV